MSTNEYSQRHWLGWAVIGGIALCAVAALGATQGWLAGPGGAEPPAACADCGVVETVRTVETPIEPAMADGGETPIDEPAAQVSYSYEITVRYDDGRTAVFSQADPPAWQAGDKVRVVDGAILVSG